MSTPNEPTDNKTPQDTPEPTDAISEPRHPAPDQGQDAVLSSTAEPSKPSEDQSDRRAVPAGGAEAKADAVKGQASVSEAPAGKTGQAAPGESDASSSESDEPAADAQKAEASGGTGRATSKPDEVSRQAVMPPIVKPARTGALWAAVVVLLILVVVLGAGGWMLWQAQQQTTERVAELSALKGTLDEERRRILDEARTQLQETLKLTEERQKAAEARLQQQISQLATKVLQQSATSRTDWLLAEAEYLLRLANQRLGLERDVKGALKVLDAADTVLAEADDPALVPVRQAIAQERAALRATGLPDRTGLFLRLNALAGQVERLSQNVFIAPVETHTSAGDQAAAEPESDWTGRLARLQQQVEKYLVIRRLDKPVEPLLSPDQIAYLKANLRLMIEQAQLAVLQQDETVYAASLEKAERWLKRWLVGQDAATTALLETLTELKSASIAPELPDISQSLRLLKGVIRQIESGEGGAS